MAGFLRPGRFRLRSGGLTPGTLVRRQNFYMRPDGPDPDNAGVGKRLMRYIVIKQKPPPVYAGAFFYVFFKEDL